MKRLLLYCTVPGLIALCGCQTHAVFSEASHTGLLVEFDGTGSVPINVDVGYERGVFIMLPQRDKATDPCLAGAITQCVDDEATTVTVHPHPGELVSLYTTHEANIGFGDPIEVRHFLATGIAAAYIVADPATLESVWEMGPGNSGQDKKKASQKSDEGKPKDQKEDES
jgi:hypothetical protein